MRNRTRKLTLAAMLAGVQVVLLLLGSVLPSGRVALAALAGVLGAGIVLECGMSWAALAWVAASLLSLLLLPQKAPAILFAAFFGWYPLVKSLAERLKNRVSEWAVKLLAFNAALALCWLLLSRGFLTGLELPAIWPSVLILGLELVFIAFDIAFTGLIGIYRQKIKNKR